MQAFVSHALVVPRARTSRATCSRRRVFVATRMSETLPDTEAAEAKPVFSDADDAAANGATGYSPPSLDTGMFSDFVETAQAKVEELNTKLQDIDGNVVLEDSKENAIGLVDNLLAGDWLNRGELYGAVQLVLVLLLLRSPGFLDGLIGFIVGPVTLFAGAAFSGKALWDLGRKQVSIWPAPVPGGELKTAGLYQQIRHPIYAGLLLASIGFSVSTGSPERFAVTLAMAAFLSKKIAIEEEYLEKTYDDWNNYVQEVPYKIIPKIW